MNYDDVAPKLDASEIASALLAYAERNGLDLDTALAEVERNANMQTVYND